MINVEEQRRKRSLQALREVTSAFVAQYWI